MSKQKTALDVLVTALQWVPTILIYASALVVLWVLYPVLKALREVRSPNMSSEDVYITFDEPEVADSEGARRRRTASAAREAGSILKSDAGNSIHRELRFPSLNDTSSVTLSLIVPAYNEQTRLPIMLDETLGYLEGRMRRESKFSYEIIVVDDGSRDRTVQVALDYVRRYGSDKIRLLKLHKNHGKGGAVRKGMLRARGEFLLMVDADGATRISDIERLEAALLDLGKRRRATQGSVAIGSRHHLMQEAVANRSLLRNLLMYGFHFYVSALCAPGVHDTQCGFKLFSRTAARRLFPPLHISRWAFDVELLHLSSRMHIPVVEVAVNWEEIPGSKVSLIESIPQMARDILVIRLCYALGLWKA